jgi:hypothetical protein
MVQAAFSILPNIGTFMIAVLLEGKDILKILQFLIFFLKF